MERADPFGRNLPWWPPRLLCLSRLNHPVANFLLAIAGIFLIGSGGELIFQRTNIPDVIWLILAGIALEPVGGLITRPLLGSIAPYFAALTLVVVLVEGGSERK